MNLRSRIFTRLTSLFRITAPQDWARISAADVLAVPDVGKSTLNKLRLYLAHRGVNLRGDNPPVYWLETLTNRDADGLDAATGFPPSGVCAFTIIVDTNETWPFTFESIVDSTGNLVSVPTLRKPLYTVGMADYSIVGMVNDIQIERKAEDLASSMSERRNAFEDEIRRLNDCCEFAAVVCEHPWRDILSDEHEHGARAKSISRTVITWQVRYPGVQWWFCDGRRHAEQVTFRLLESFWWMKMREQSRVAIATIAGSLFSEV